jgi:CO/xanthine dehydrogenase Mo-binding subunit
MKMKAISRRELLKAGGALVVSFSFSGPISRAVAQSGGEPITEPLATSLDSWLAVAQDGTVTVFTSKVELGTGVETALAQMVAEELDVPFRQIKMETGDTSKTVDQGMTVAARTVERAGPQLRQAAAAARQELLKLASTRLQAPVEQLVVNDGVVSVAGNPAKKISYGDIIGGKRFNVSITATGTGDNMNLAAEARAKHPKDYKIVGTSVPRIDLPPKFTGEDSYVHNVRIPGMLHGRVVRPPVVNSKPSSIDESSIQHISGVVKVVQEGSFVGVVAKTEWAAIQAARALKVTWSRPTAKLPANRAELDDYLRNTKSAINLTPVNKGDVAAALGQGSRTFEATYRWPFQLHGMVGPSCAVADVRGDKATIWTGTQAPFPTRLKVAKLLGIPEKNVRVIHREGSGCYGRLEPDDVPEDAVLMSRAVGEPVRVQWMRDDEHGWEPKGPPHLTTVRAAVDSDGKITAWDFLDRSFPWTDAGNTPLLASRQVGIKATDPGFNNGARMAGEVYDFDHQKIVAANLPWQTEGPIPLRTSNLRSPGETQRCFASECFMDEIAAALHVDAVQFRLRYLSDTRHREVLLAATQKAGWKERPSPGPVVSGSKAHGRGVAIAGHEPRTLIAAVAEVEVNRSTGKVHINRVTLAHDCGLIVNPDGVRNQVQGNVIQGVSRTLLEEVQFDASGVKSLDWKTYPFLTFAEVPEIDIVLINRPDMPPLGAGEAAIVAVPAAIGNAIFDATGVRLRDVPLTPQRVLDALKAKGA